MRLGAIFPGQGSQVVGMGVDVAASSSQAASLFERASSLLGYDLLALCREGPQERLRETKFSQPAIFVTNYALAVAAAEGESLAPIVSAGHSFGEYCSLVLAEALEFEEALGLVQTRGEAMQYAAEVASGAMSAILGLDVDEIETAVRETRDEGIGRIGLANFNAPSQIVISGDVEAVRRAGDRCLEAGAKRVVPLNVSGAWHSELMEPAVERFAPKVEAARVALPRFEVISNVDAQPYRDVAHIKANLIRSLTAQVLWHETSSRLISRGLDLVVEFGASSVLAPLLRRAPSAPEVMTVSDRAGIENVQQRLGAPVRTH